MKSFFFLTLLMLLQSCGKGTKNGVPTKLNQGSLFIAESSATSVRELVMKLDDSSEEEVIISPFQGSQIYSYYNHIAYVRANASGKDEVYVFDLVTKTETALPALNSGITSYTPTIIAFSYGNIIVNTNTAFGAYANHKAIYKFDVSEISSGGVWSFVDDIGGADTTASVKSNNYFGVSGTLTATTGTKAFNFFYSFTTSDLEYVSKCPGLNPTCPQAMTFVGAKYNEIYYVGTDDVSGLGVHLRKFDGSSTSIVADNLNGGYTGVSGMSFSGTDTLFIASNGSSNQVMRVNDTLKDLVAEYPVTNVSKLFSIGSDFFIVGQNGANSSSLYKNGILADGDQIDLISYSTDGFALMKNGNQELGFFKGNLSSVTFHDDLTNPALGYGNSFKGIRSYISWTSATDNAPAAYSHNSGSRWVSSDYINAEEVASLYYSVQINVAP